MPDQEISSTTWVKRFRRSKYWTLIFVDDCGRVVHFERVKGLVLILLGLVLVSGVIALGALKITLDLAEDKQHLNDALASLNQEMISLSKEKENILVKLVRQGSSHATENEDARDNNPKETPKRILKQPHRKILNKPAQTLSEKDSEKPVSSKKAVKKNIATAVNPEKIREKSPYPPVSSKKPITVIIDNFSVSHDPSKNVLRVRFKLSTASRLSSPVSGHTAVILKNLGADQNKWLTLPAGALDTRNSGADKMGQAFSMLIFKYVNLTTVTPVDPKALKTATVFVFDNAGNLIEEKEFPINLS